MTGHEGTYLRWIKPEEVRLGEWLNKSDALAYAKMATRETGVRHQIFLTHSYRALLPVICWTVCLALHWKHGKLVTK